MRHQRSIFITGATGFIGTQLANRLAESGEHVTALIHRRDGASLAPEIERIRGDVTDPLTFRAVMRGADVVYHLAADYRIGPIDREAMRRANVEGTRCVLDTAIALGVPRIVVASSTAALGETHGRAESETHRHNGAFRSFYEETKHIAHGIARARRRAGAPVSIAVLGGVFGDGDRSVLAQALGEAARGKLPISVATSSRFTLCDVQSICDGLVRIGNADSAGEWILAGDDTSMPELLDQAAESGGCNPPRALSPRVLAPLARALDRVSKLIRRPLPLSSEALAIMDGSTYVYTSTKATHELGWHPRSLAQSMPAYLESLQSGEPQ